jgi:hypothetical protein
VTEKMKTSQWRDVHESGSIGLPVVKSLAHVKNLDRFLTVGSVSRGTIRGPGLNSDKLSRELRKQLLTLRLLEYSGADAKLPGLTRAWREIDGTSVQIVKDSLGKPRVLCGTESGPSVSFAHLGAGTWGAMCPSSATVGIDVAQAEEFSDGYPFSRVFHEEDLTVTLKKTHDDEKEAAALLWSAKEAIVKAIGCGFHLLDPIDVKVVPWFDEGSEYILRGQVRGRSLGRLPMSMHLDVPISAVREENTWICTALLDLGHSREIEPDLVI